MEKFPYWSMQTDQLFGGLHASANGLSQSEATEILRQTGPNQIRSRKRITPFGLFLNQFKSPIVIILIFATIVSAFLQDWADAIIIFLIVLGSALLELLPGVQCQQCRRKAPRPGLAQNQCTAGWEDCLDPNRGGCPW